MLFVPMGLCPLVPCRSLQCKTKYSLPFGPYNNTYIIIYIIFCRVCLWMSIFFPGISTKVISASDNANAVNDFCRSDFVKKCFIFSISANAYMPNVMSLKLHTGDGGYNKKQTLHYILKQILSLIYYAHMSFIIALLEFPLIFQLNSQFYFCFKSFVCFIREAGFRSCLVWHKEIIN